MLIKRVNSDMEVYLSPEILKCIQNSDLQNLKNVNRFKNDTFCLGLTIMELGLLKSLTKVITKEKIFDKNLLASYFTQFKMEYKNNKLLIAMVKAMIELTPMKRPTPIGKYYFYNKFI